MRRPVRASIRRLLTLISCLSLACAVLQSVSFAAAPRGALLRKPVLGKATPGRALPAVPAAAVDHSSAAVPVRRWPRPGSYPLTGLSAGNWRSVGDGSLAIRPQASAEPSLPAGMRSARCSRSARCRSAC